MKKIILISVSLCWTIVLCAQDIVFNKTYNAQTPGLRNIIIQDDGYIGLGFDVNAEKIRIYILKTDFYGDTIWTKTYGDSEYSYYHGTRNSLQMNSDGGYSLAGHRTNTANDYRACMLMKFDQNFDTLWTKLYFDNANFTVFYNHIQTTDGGYILVGTHDEGDPDGDVLLVKTDSDGNMLWYKKYGTSGRDMGLCIVETDDGGYLIGGDTRGLGNGNGYLLKTDANGNLQWTKNYGNPLYPDGTIHSIVKTPDNEYIIPLTSYVTDPISASFYNRKYNIIKLDSDFNEIWNKQYGVRAEYTGLGSIVIANNGDMLATIKDDHVVGLLRLSADGDSISKHYYIAEGSPAKNALLAIKQTPDNGFIMAGVAYEPQVMWLVKTDSCGCVEEDCECGGSEVEEFTNELFIEVYPNPASDVLYFNLPENTKSLRVEIYDNLGRQIITNELLGLENSIDVKQLKAGNYFVRIVSDNRNWRGWFVKE